MFFKVVTSLRAVKRVSAQLNVGEVGTGSHTSCGIFKDM